MLLVEQETLDLLKSLQRVVMVCIHFIFIGSAKIWDPRTNKPVVSLEPADSEKILPECWAVA